MHIKYISDIHLERREMDIIPFFIELIGHGEVLVLAGNIGNPFSSIYQAFINRVSNNFEKVFIICGNHEYFTHKTDKVDLYMSYTYPITKKVSDITNRSCIFKKVPFIGSTLWSLSNHFDDRQYDTKLIKDFSMNKRNRFHFRDIQFIDDELDKYEGYQCIIVTHHLPSYDLIQENYTMLEYEKIHEWVASNTIELVMYNNVSS